MFETGNSYNCNCSMTQVLDQMMCLACSDFQTAATANSESNEQRNEMLCCQQDHLPSQSSGLLNQNGAVHEDIDLPVCIDTQIHA